MLKRLSATLNPSSSSSSPSSISPSHSSNSSLDRWSGAGVGQGQQQQQQQQHHHAAPSHYSGLSPSLNDTNASNPRVGHSSYPRPSGLSTPYSITPTTTTSNTANNEISPVSGYFGIPHSSSSSLNGGLTPSLHTTSRNVSPAQSPRLEYASMPASSSNEGISSSINNNNNNWATNTPPAPIDRQTLQKSLRCLETMLVALDEYRELSSRLAKVEKRIAKAGRDLAVSMSDGNSNNNNSGNKGRGGPTSIGESMVFCRR